MHVSSTSRPAFRVLLTLDWYDHRIHRGVARVAAERGWHLDAPTLIPGWATIPAGWRGDGCIGLLHHRSDWARLRRACRAMVDIGLRGGDMPRVVVDNPAIARLALEHFRERGFRSLAVFGPWGGNGMFDQRITAFQEAASQAGIACHHLVPPPMQGRDAWIRRARQVGRALRELPRPLGVFAVQDALGADVVRAAAMADLSVPEEVAVLGVDDQDLVCEAMPVPLASIDSDLEGLGRAAAIRLAELLERPSSGAMSSPAETVLWPPAGVVERASTEALGTSHPGLRAALVLARQDPACGVQALARAAGLSLQGLDKACRRELGQPPGNVLRSLRLRSARRALAGGADLRAAAAAAGLGSSGALCALFRRHLGTSPGRWRRQDPNDGTGRH